MYRRLVAVRRFIGGLIACGLLVQPFWFVLFYITCSDPYWYAEPVARDHATANGVRTFGYLGLIVSQPGVVGDCELEFRFSDVAQKPRARKIVVRVRRSWFFGGWRATDSWFEAITPEQGRPAPAAGSK